MTAVESFAGPRVELARYLTSDGERVIYAVRVGGMVVVSDWPAHGAGRWGAGRAAGPGAGGRPRGGGRGAGRRVRGRAPRRAGGRPRAGGGGGRGRGGAGGGGGGGRRRVPPAPGGVFRRGQLRRLV